MTSKAQRINYSQIEALTDGRDRGTQHAIEQAISDINYTDRAIRDRIDYLRSSLDQVERHLSEDLSLNSEGELGRTPFEIDMAISRNHHAWQTLAALLDDDQTKRLLASRKTARDTAAAK